MNPYDFVPLGEPSPRRPPLGHHQLANGGLVRARLTTLGPFLIAQQTQGMNTITPLGQGRIIPGSSLKGMLRSTAEAVGGGCISVSSTLNSRKPYPHASVPRSFQLCSRRDALCVTCHMFGALVAGSAWKGLVEPGEARWLGAGQPETRMFNVIVGQPKPDHHAFYVRNGQIRGRKAYYHHPDKILESAPAHRTTFGARQTMQVRALVPGQDYEFSVRHKGLDKLEYQLLLYSMFLEPGLAHKCGWGKPMGFGSVRIEPLHISKMDLHARYRRHGENATTTWDGPAAIEHVREVTQALRDNTNEVMQALRKLFAYPGPDAEWRYPGYAWFKENPTVSLEAFNEGHRE